MNKLTSVGDYSPEPRDERQIARARRILKRPVSVDSRYPGDPQSSVALEQHDTRELVQYWRALLLHKWSILALGVLAAVIAGIVVYSTVPVYRSTATVLIEIDKTKLVPMSEAGSGVGTYYREYMQTQVELLKFRRIAQRVVAQLKLTQHPEFQPRQNEPLNEVALESAVLTHFDARLRVEPVRMSQLIKISFDAQDPALAATVANAIADTYIKVDLDARDTVGGQLIAQRLADLKATLDASEAAVQAYRDREDLLDRKSTVLSGAGRQLDELTQRLADARVRRVEAEQAFRQAQGGEAAGAETVPAVVKSASVQRAKQIAADATRRVAELSERYGPNHPILVQANSELSAAKANTRQEIRSLAQSIGKEYEAALATERTIQRGLVEAKSRIQNMNRKDIQLGMLELEAATNRQVYQAFLSRSREASATKDTSGFNARLVDPAVPAVSPIRPAKKLTVTLATASGLLLGVIGALLTRLLNNTVRTSTDVEEKLHQPFLAALPILSGTLDLRTFFDSGVNERESRRAAADNARHLYAESIRTVSTRVFLSALRAPCKSITITSSTLAEGKSTFAMAFAFSQSKTQRVLLVEGDMRGPCFNEAMNLPERQKGVSDLIAGSATFEECVLHVDGTSLDVLAAGSAVSDPLQLLAPQKLHDLVAMLEDAYDMIVIDSPPVQVVSDALILGSQTSGIIFITKANHTPVPLARTALKRIASANIPIIGVVLNQQDFEKAKKYYGEYSVSGKYGYGLVDRAGNSAAQGSSFRMVIPPISMLRRMIFPARESTTRLVAFVNPSSKIDPAITEGGSALDLD
jgi:succinoglycan biosynthesis transport protein ExoP